MKSSERKAEQAKLNRDGEKKREIKRKRENERGKRGGWTKQMRAARREGQRDAPLCPVGCKRNLLSGYAVPAVLTVAGNNVACHTAIFDILMFFFFLSLRGTGLSKFSLCVDRNSGN